MTSRKLRESEINLAREVFGDSLPYNRVYLVNYHLPRNDGVAVTTAQPTNEGGIAFMRLKVNYFIYWGSGVYDHGADSTSYLNGKKVRDTFIHELTHVWQGHNGSNPFTYMAESLGVQGWAWLHHGDRNRAYWYDPNNLGHWSSYNVEQQACLVEHWFSEDDRRRDDGVIIQGGHHSQEDPRFPYIIYNIRPGKNDAGYIPVVRQPAPQRQRPAGFSAEIERYQEVLYMLGYLTDRKYVDGFMGATTRRAVRAFQERNGLAVDSDLGGARSRTRALLAQDPATLRRAR